MADAPSFTLTQSGTFAKEDFVINKSGIAAVNGEGVPGPGFRLQDLQVLHVLGRGASPFCVTPGDGGEMRRQTAFPNTET